MTTAYSPDDGAGLDTTPPRRRPRALAWTSVMLSAALIVASVALVDARQVLARLEAADPRWLLAFFVLHVLQIVLLGLRWSTISRGLGVPLSWRRGSAEFALSILVNQLLPTGVAGDGWRAVRHARRASNHPFMRIVEALALDRLSGQLVLLAVVLSSAPWTIQHGLVQPKAASIATALIAACLLALGCAVWALRRGGGVSTRLHAFFRRAAAALVEPRRAVLHLGISLLLIATCLGQLAFAARALGVDLRLELLLWLGPLIMLAASVPSFFGGWGIREGASALLFHGVGLGGSTGVAVSLLFGAFALVCALPGFIVLLFEGQFSRRRRVPGGAEVTWSKANALAMLGGTAMALILNIPALLAFVGVLSLLFFIAAARSREVPGAQFGWVNGASSLRLLLTLGLLVGVAREPSHVTAMIAATSAGLGFVQGWLARQPALQSRFEARLAREVDAVFALSLSCALWVHDVAGWWVLIGGLAPYLVVAILLVADSPRREASRAPYDRAADALLVMSFLLALVAPPPLAQVLAVFGTVAVAGSCIRTLYLRYSPFEQAIRGA